MHRPRCSTRWTPFVASVSRSPATQPEPAWSRTATIWRSCAFNAFWALWTTLFGFLIPLLWLIGSPPGIVRKFTRIWARGALFELAWTLRIYFRELGRNHVPKEPCLIICNHQSTWETLAALVLFPDVAIIAKRELLRIPVLGWFLRRSPMIIIDRDSAGSALRKMVTESAAALAAG